MRTTIEMNDAHRARLLELAARRGLKGFSLLVEEAIADYLLKVEQAAQQREQVLQLRGILSADEASQLTTATDELRRSWR